MRRRRRRNSLIFPYRGEKLTWNVSLSLFVPEGESEEEEDEEDIVAEEEDDDDDSNEEEVRRRVPVVAS